MLYLKFLLMFASVESTTLGQDTSLNYIPTIPPSLMNPTPQNPPRTAPHKSVKSGIYVLGCIAVSLAGVDGWAATATSGMGTPTLARLSFWVHGEKMREFETAYQTKVVPILARHGLVASARKSRSASEGIFSRLFELETPSEVQVVDKALREDPAFGGIMRELGPVFGTNKADGQILHSFMIYTSPAGPGTVVRAGSGKVVPAGAGKGHWRTYDVTDGLGGSRINSILQDRDGYLWFCTNGGASRYDGRTFKTFTTQDGLGNNRVFSILQDRQGYLWFGTWEGVSRYDPSTSSGGASSTNLAGAEPTPGEPSGPDLPSGSGKTVTTYTPKDGLADKSVFSILQDRDGMIWLGSPNGGVTRYDPSGGGFAILDTKGRVANTVSSILQDREGYFWFSTLGGGVSRYDPSWPTRGTSSGQDGIEWIKFTTKDGLADNYVYSIFQDRDNHIWFATNGGLSRYDGSTFSNFTVKDGLANNTVISILQDRDGYFWFSTYDGLSRYNGSTFSNFTVKDGLANNYMASSYQDREGYIWFGTLTGAVSRYDGEAFTTFTTEDGLGDNAVMSISHDRKGHLWFGTADGLSLYDGRTFTTFTTRDGLAHNTVMSVFQDREGHLWFGTGGGLSRYDGDTFATFTARDGLAHDVVISIFQDREGHLWFGTKDGVSRYEPSTRSGDIKGTFTTFTAQDGLGYDQVMSIFQDTEGNLWFGTEGGGVSRYDGDVLTTFTTRDGLADVSIGRSSILQDREGYLWFGTQTGGMSRFDPSASSGHAFTTFTTRDGLANNQVTSAFKDRDGNLWFGTGGRGVSRYDGTAFTTFTTQDGLAASQVSSIFQDREGYLWFGTSSGVTRYRTQAPSPPPRVHPRSGCRPPLCGGVRNLDSIECEACGF